MKLDFLARQRQYIDHLAPIWKKFPLERRGIFHVSDAFHGYAMRELGGESGISVLHENRASGMNPILTCAYGDMIRSGDGERKLIMMEHGVGLTFGTAGYADGQGRRGMVDLFLMPNEHTAAKSRAVRDTPCEVIGTPKMDEWGIVPLADKPNNVKPAIGISFHWGNRSAIPPESGSAWEHYRSFLSKLAGQYKIIGHAHPSAMDEQRREYETAGIEFVEDFRDLIARAHIYINDCSSTAYEWLLTGRPVILLNAPWFRRNKHFGIRFWEYSDIGINVDSSRDLIPAIEETWDNYPNIRWSERAKAIQDLYPYRGQSTTRAVEVLIRYLDAQPKEEIHPIEITDHRQGVIYMAFGQRARDELRKSIKSLRQKSGNLPAVVVGDEPVPGLGFIPWQGENPFEAGERRNFQFRAGRVKPALYDLSPFERTLYVDCDTIFKKDICKGFAFLEHWDFVIAQERLSINQLYNRPLVGWEHNMIERDTTVAEFGGDGNFPFLNSGVFFFRKNERVRELFKLWRAEWDRFQQWDEQAALMRALNKGTAQVMVLSEVWNYPHNDNDDAVIVHLYGRGAARMNKP